MVGCQCFDYATLLHYDEAHTINLGPILVLTCGEQLSRLLIQCSICIDYLNKWRRSQAIYVSDDSWPRNAEGADHEQRQFRHDIIGYNDFVALLQGILINNSGS